jgi:hypothetical protein
LLHRGGGWFVTGYDTARTPFLVEDGSGQVLVDPSNAWLSLAPANAPTTTAVDAEGATTGGTAEYEVVVGAGEELPEQVRADPDTGAIAADPPAVYDPPADGVADRDTRFKEQCLEPGEEVVVVGEAAGAPLDAPADTVVRGDGPRSFVVAVGTRESVAAGLRWTVRHNAVIAVSLLLVGAPGLLWLVF